jgi:hypothetical protein
MMIYMLCVKLQENMVFLAKERAIYDFCVKESPTYSVICYFLSKIESLNLPNVTVVYFSIYK